MRDGDMEVSIGRLRLKNPVMTASGTAGYGENLSNYLDLSALGAFITKGISIKPRHGNSPPRVVETPAGMLNAIGLENIGVDAFISEKLPFLRKQNTTVIINMYATSPDEFGLLASMIARAEGVSALEVNISCPNVQSGGMHFGMDPSAAGEVTRAVREAAPGLPVLVKLSPEAPDIAAVAQSVEKAGADALCVMNTIRGLSVDVETRRPRLANVYGGLSGPAIRPLAVRLVHEVNQCVDIPIVGVGGIRRWCDAAEFILAGATAVQIGTSLLINPLSPIEILEGLSSWVRQNGCSIRELTGAMKV